MMTTRLSDTEITALVNQLDYYGIIGVATYDARDRILAQRPEATCVNTGVSLSITQPRPGYRDGEPNPYGVRCTDCGRPMSAHINENGRCAACY